MAASSISVSAQQVDTESSTGQNAYIELFSGIDFNYRDILLDRPYQVLINLTPGLKWHIWDHLQLNAGFILPVINQYGEAYARPRIDVLSLSHQFKIKKIAMKPSVGLFTQERYGLDLKTMYPVTDWLALEGQLGYTGYMSMATEWFMSPLSRIMALGGFDIYLKNWDTQFRLIGGRFLKDDKGLYCEGYRHFNHTSVGLYLQCSDFNTNNGRQYSSVNGGFKIIIALPPYHRSHKKVQFRASDAFRITYNMNADPHSCKTYFTDSEQNERHGWFSADILPWGANNLHDFE